MTTTGIFRDVRQALSFSYVMATIPAREGGKLGRLLDRLKLEATGVLEARELSSIRFDGLDEMEVRGQCALVRATVEHHLPQPEAWAIRSRFGEVHIRRSPSREVIAASYGVDRTRMMIELARYLAPAYASVSPDAMLLVIARICGDCDELRPTFRRIEAETGLPKSTAERLEKNVRTRINTLTRLACDRLEPMFLRDGLVRPAEETSEQMQPR